MMGENAERLMFVKKIILVLLFSLLFSGVVSASSINGDYKGNSIVLVKSDGKQLETDEVPAQIIDGHTLVPISLLRQLGASVTWEDAAYSVDVKLPKDPLNFSVSGITKEIKDYGVNSVSYNSDGVTNSITYHYGAIIDNITNEQFNKIIFSSATTDATMTTIDDSEGNLFSVPTQGIRDLALGKITADELTEQYQITRSNNSTNPVPNPVPVNPPSSAVQPDQQVNQEIICKNLQDKYASEKWAIDQLDPFNGASITKKQEFENEWSIQFAIFGCKKP